MNHGAPAENIEWTGLERWHCYLHLTGEGLVLISHGLTQHDAEVDAHQWLVDHPEIPDSSCHMVTARIIESVEIGDFLMRGPTPEHPPQPMPSHMPSRDKVRARAKDLGYEGVFTAIGDAFTKGETTVTVHYSGNGAVLRIYTKDGRSRMPGIQGAIYQLERNS